MRAPLLLLLVSLQIIQALDLGKCRHIMTGYGRCLSGSLLLKYYPQCCFHPNFQNNIRCKWLHYRRKKRAVGCNPAEHVVAEVDNTSPYVAPTCGTLYKQIKHRNDFFKCPEMIKTCGARYLRYLPQCCINPAISSNHRMYRMYCRGSQYYRRKRADFDSKLIDPSPDTNYGFSEVSEYSLRNITEKSTNNLPPMFLETDVTTSNTSLDVLKFRSKRQSKSVVPVLPASLLDELAENSPEAVSVTCCKDSTPVVCGADTGKRCSTACANQAVDAVDMVNSDDVCDPEITGGGAGRRRRKRGARWSAATMASWKINWCPKKVTSRRGGNIWWYRICCFHPSVVRHRYTYNTDWTTVDKEKTVGSFCHHKVSKIFPKTNMG